MAMSKPNIKRRAIDSFVDIDVLGTIDPMAVAHIDAIKRAQSKFDARHDVS